MTIVDGGQQGGWAIQLGIDAVSDAERGDRKRLVGLNVGCDEQCIVGMGDRITHSKRQLMT